MSISIRKSLAAAFMVALLLFTSDPAHAGREEAARFIQIGNDHLVRMDYDRAIESFSNAIDADPNFADPYVLRGSVLREKGLFEEAIEDYGLALSIGQSYDAHFNRAIAYTDMGEDKKAIEDYTSAIKIDPTKIFSYNNRAILYMINGMYDDGIKDFTKIIELDPGNAITYNNRHAAFRDSGDFKSALKDLDKVAELAPGDPGPFYNKSRIYSMMGNAVYACKSLETAVSMGFRDFEMLEEDPALDNVRDSSCFKKIVGGR